MDGLIQGCESEYVLDILKSSQVRKQWHAWVHVQRWVDERGEDIDEAHSTCPWHFWMSRAPTHQLTVAYKAGCSEVSSGSVFDLKTGINFVASRAGEFDAIVLKQLPPSPIYPEDDEFEMRTERLMSRVVVPDFKVSTTEELRTFVMLLKASVRATTRYENNGGVEHEY